MKIRILTISLMLLALISIIFNSVILGQVQRNPVIEACTGTWCQWCPCGHTVIDNILADMPNAIAIEYHGPTASGDPWSGFQGNQIIPLLSFSAYPTGVIDRTGPPQSRTLWPNLMNYRFNVPAAVDITIEKSYNVSTRDLNVIIHTTPLTDLTGVYKLSFLILESGLVYNQTGNYSCAGGFNYIHNHVVRSMINGAEGETLNGVNPWNTGQTISKNILYNVPSQFIAENCELVAFVYKVVSPLYNGEIQQAEKWPLVNNSFQLSVNISEGWNLVSIPGLLPTNQNVNTWWQYRDPNANVFKYSGGYQFITDAVPGTGYWMKHAGALTYNTGEEWPAGGIQIVTHDALSGSAGWNLIGGYENNVETSGLTTIPAGLISGPVYAYSGGYYVTSNLIPGYAYWIKLTSAGQINIGAGTAGLPTGQAGPSKIAIPSTEGFGKITITDNLSQSYTLYTVNNEAENSVDVSQFDLPPYPPQGMFDVRYSSQRYAENLSSTPQVIEMMGVQHPVKIKAEGVGIIISDESGKEITRLKAGEEFTLSTSINKLMVSENIIPTVYALEQNYPNPFNPSTTIQFSIPEDVQNVKLIVYNALGEKVAELVNTGLQAGVYKYPWDAGNYASGIYIYQLVTEKFVSTKKMMLLK